MAINIDLSCDRELLEKCESLRRIYHIRRELEKREKVE